MKVRIISISQPVQEFADTLPSELRNPEGIMAYAARVSSERQDNPNYAKLLKYCAEHSHWSVFETASMTAEIKTSRGISPQILRHKSFSMQEFSQRYQQVTDFEIYEARRQDKKNRQNSTDDLPQETKDWFIDAQKQVQALAMSLYEEALSKDIAKEQARFLLPAGASTTLYMTGSVRSWIHYLLVRTDPATQKEHRDIAEAIKEIFLKNFPISAEAMGWVPEEVTND